ncbi:MAG: DUF5683 domain-containing protein, partial [Janthinobacterium lividum]
VNTRGDTTSVLVPFKPKSEQGVQKVYHPDSTHSPHKAIIKSLMLPGTGQIYNRQYWKLPIVYGGFAGLAYSFHVAQTNYKPLLNELKAREKGSTTDAIKYPKDVYTDPYLTVYKDFYHRNRDLTIIGTVAFWGIQAIDAYIAAKFQHSYTMDNNLAFKISTSILSESTYACVGFVPGLKVTMEMK